MSQVSTEQIKNSLKQCMDPEVPLSIVDMGLIYGIDVTENNDVNIKMTMTTKGCPLHDTMVDDVTRYTKKVPGVNNVQVDIVWDPPWSMDKMSNESEVFITEHIVKDRKAYLSGINLVLDNLPSLDGYYFGLESILKDRFKI